tara:strand:+ start:68 stop:817 length:750 start_codon:yes stop_codon:yes gene_type:complete
MSNIEYERTIQIRYKHDDEITNDNMRRLAHELQKRGITLCDNWGGSNPKYGYQERVIESSLYLVHMNDELLFKTPKNYVAHDACTAINEHWSSINKGDEPCTVQRVDDSRITKEWRKVQGNYIKLHDMVENSPKEYMTFSIGKHRMTEDNVDISGRIYNGYTYLQLTIETTWNTDGVKRTEEIENMLVNKPLSIVGEMQRIFESAIKLKKYGYDVDDVEIDCNFKAITANESKCSPDIVKMTRDARKAS